jgi:hypothetical protein
VCRPVYSYLSRYDDVHCPVCVPRMFQAYIMRTRVSGICDVQTEGNSVVMCSWVTPSKHFVRAPAISICSDTRSKSPKKSQSGIP